MNNLALAFAKMNSLYPWGKYMELEYSFSPHRSPELHRQQLAIFLSRLYMCFQINFNNFDSIMHHSRFINRSERVITIVWYVEYRTLWLRNKLIYIYVLKTFNILLEDNIGVAVNWYMIIPLNWTHSGTGIWKNPANSDIFVDYHLSLWIVQ